MNKFLYIGAILPDVPSSRFVTSIFYHEGTKQYYVQEENEIENDRIERFIEIKVPKNLQKVNSQLQVSEGEPYIYSYTVEKKDIFYGSRQEIAKRLITLINSDQLNVHSQLLLSAFLNLDGKTMQLVDDSNKDFEINGIKDRIDAEIFFQNASHVEETSLSVMDQILKEYENCKNDNASINITDIVFIKDDIAYFNKKTIDAKNIIKKNLLGNNILNKMISEIIGFCSEKKLINLSKILASNEAYEFMLESEFLVLDQKEIERNLSLPVKEDKLSEEESILNIGIEFDKKIFRFDENAETINNPTSLNEKALSDSFRKIIELAI